MDTTHFEVNVSFDESSVPNLEEAAFQAYNELFEQIQSKGLHPLRFWNLVPEINENADERGNGAEERYKVFNRGRRKAWLEYDPTLAAVCASTCVGSFGPDILEVSCLATNLPVIHLENPNQISFLEYSSKYGTPPSSRRGTLHLTPEGIEVWISGTASIVGESNRFAGDNEPKDVIKQTEQTLENIKVLISDANLKKHYQDGQPRNLSLKNLRDVKVYLRNIEDQEKVNRILAEANFLPNEVKFVRADICRRPLDVEIEGMIPAVN